MFNQLVVSGANQEGTHKRWTVATSFGVQIIIVGIMILIPLIYTEALPKGMLNTFLVAPAPPPPPPPPAAPVKVVRPRIVQPQTMTAPTVIPKKVEMIKDEAPDVGAAGNGFGVAGGTGDALGGGILNTAPPPPPKGAIAPLKRKLEAAEEALARETRLFAEVDALLASPSTYGDPARLADVRKRHARMLERLAEAESQWMQAAEVYEAAQA